MSKVQPIEDNTTFVTMVHPLGKDHPQGGTIKAPVSPRHASGRTVERLEKKGFKRLEVYDREQAEKAERAQLEAENARLRAELEAKSGGPATPPPADPPAEPPAPKGKGK